MKKNAFLSLSIAALITVNPLSALAHGGRTDSSGGHKDNKNVSGLGSYHYHCGGNPAHLHSNGTCPYSSSAKKSSGTSNKKTSTTKVKANETNKNIQNKLNELGYDCGTPDGVLGKKSKDAIKKFQKDNGLTSDGIPGKETKKKLGL